MTSELTNAIEALREAEAYERPGAGQLVPTRIHDLIRRADVLRLLWATPEPPQFDFSHLGKDDAIEAAVEVIRRVATPEPPDLASITISKGRRQENHDE